MHITTDLRDIIYCPSAEAPYTALKEANICISLSKQKRLQRLISEEDLGDRKPTQFLWRLEKLTDGQSLDATMFQQLLPQRQPSFVQAILAPCIPSSSVQVLVESADRILEYLQPTVAVNVASPITAAPTAPTIENFVERQDLLTHEVFQFRASRVSRRQIPSTTRRLRSPTAVSGPYTPDSCCWSHCTYGLNAHHCKSQNVPADAKVSAIREFPDPTASQQLRGFMGLVRFYPRFIPQCAQLMLLLTNPLPGNNSEPFFPDPVVYVFQRVKETLVDTTVLSHLMYVGLLAIVADASNCTMGAAIQQQTPTGIQLLSFCSAKLTLPKSF
ncbi:hypothetical protein SprV_0702403000 [Sparganum proliferum]